MLERSSSFETLVAELNKLPGIGRKSAERLAYHIIKMPKDEALRLSSSIKAVKEKIFFCSLCFNLTEHDPCSICSDPSRKKDRILVVEDPMDIAAFERSGVYHGIYHALQGRIIPLKGITPDRLRIKELLDRIEKGGIREVILATNPDVEGEATALYISKQLASFDLEVTRIGLGVPMGGSLEFSDSVTLGKALEGRKKFS
ncbi:recombination protein RecR [Candidatus Sumerlaeota bacterium]|nr:recombination protein RecR [Candidatus Sumerlaeota bacterium]